MTPLFHQSVIDQYLAKLNESDVKKAFKTLKTLFSASIQQRINGSSELSFQSEFVEFFFDDVLGYTRFPKDDWQIKREHDSETSNERADAAIVIDSNEAKTLAVVELKSTKTHSLQSIEGQVFNYFGQHPICRYAITSNFQMVRLYIDNKEPYEQFSIFDMVNNDEYDQFKRMYLFLHPKFIYENLPAKIREATIQKEKKITANLYEIYFNFRLELHKPLHKQNPHINSFTLFKKTQKLIDRFLFIFFAEDKGLLPERTIANHISEWKKGSKVSLYESFKTLFNDINVGNKAKDIFAYNGGLFDSDAILDSIKLDIGNVLEVYLDVLQGFDYKTEVDVNILGHIFEQSLNDMDEMKALSEGKTLEKGKTKRKKEGVFYTPQYITRYIIDNTIGVLCRKKEQELGIVDGQKVTKSQLNAYSEWLSTVKVLDPACGSGAFLNQTLSFFISEYERIDERMAGLNGKPIIYYPYTDQILENNIFGVDLNEEAVDIAKLSLWLRTAKKGKKLSNLSGNIKMGNSLISDPSVSDAAFDWKKAFPKVFEKGGFDVIVGNPPYVRQEVLTPIKPYLEKHFKSYQSTADLYVYFFEQSLNLLKKDGVMGFISSNKFVKANYGKELRQYLAQFDIQQIIDFGELPVFQDAATFPAIYVIGKQKPQNKTVFCQIQDLKFTILEKAVFDTKIVLTSKAFDGANWSLAAKNDLSILDKMNEKGKPLADLAKDTIKRGLITGFNEAFVIDEATKEQLLKADKKNKDLIKPFVAGDDIRNYRIEYKKQYLILVKIGTDLPKDYPSVYKHLLQYQTQLEKRWDKGNFWYELRACDYYDKFESPKIMYPDISKDRRFTYDESGYYMGNTGYFFNSKDLYLLAVLNSRLIFWYYGNIASVLGDAKAGGRLRWFKQDVERIPIVDLDEKSRKPFREKAAFMLSENAKLQTIQNDFLEWVQKRFPTLSVKKSMESWYLTEWKTFESDLKKQKCQLLPKEQTEWASYFEKERQKALAIVKKLESMDREIDSLVYQLYGLTKEEIRIIEG